MSALREVRTVLSIAVWLTQAMPVGISTVTAQVSAPWQTSAGRACLEQWIDEAVTRLNAHHGTDEFNVRKPWTINRFGVLEANPAHSSQPVYPPHNLSHYNNNRYWYIWDQYHYHQWHPKAGWSLPEWNAAGIPPLRENVMNCVAKSSPAPQASEAEPHTFFEPTFAGYRLDWCLHYANRCGKPAADRFCRAQGFVGARSWRKATDISHLTPTYIIGDERLCKLRGCDGFIMIACQSQPLAPTPGEMEYNTARWGADYRRLELAAPALCQAECTKEKRCKAWSHIEPGYQGANASCWLKHSIPKPLPDACCASGVKAW